MYDTTASAKGGSARQGTTGLAATATMALALTIPLEAQERASVAPKNMQAIGEALMHLGFYAGSQRAVTATKLAAIPYDERRNAMHASPVELQITSAGQSPSAGPDSYFTGTVRIDTQFKGTGAARIGGARVTFSAGARTAWHTHPLGQTLYVLSGEGRVQREGGPIETIRAGDIVWIPAEVRHWHGASPTSEMSHFAVAEALDGKSVEWMEQVTDAQYLGE